LEIQGIGGVEEGKPKGSNVKVKQWIEKGEYKLKLRARRAAAG
jgi:hypothetical protein